MDEDRVWVAGWSCGSSVGDGVSVGNFGRVERNQEWVKTGCGQVDNVISMGI